MLQFLVIMMLILVSIRILLLVVRLRQKMSASFPIDNGSRNTGCLVSLRASVKSVSGASGSPRSRGTFRYHYLLTQGRAVNGLGLCGNAQGKGSKKEGTIHNGWLLVAG